MHLSAQRIHNGHGWLPYGSTIVVSDDGLIEEAYASPTPETVYYEGILAPGFVNVHCHLELSHMRGMIPEHTGLIPFLKNVTFRRNEHTPEQKQAAALEAYNELFNNGIVAVGDIANTTDTLDLRKLDHLHFHTFIEALGFTEANAAKSFGYAVNTYDQFAAQEKGKKSLAQTITPHAPYSVSRALFRAIDAHNEGGLMSIHNQESEQENLYYISKQGDVQDLLHTLGINDDYFVPTGLSSFRSYMEWLGFGRPYILVHNTFTSREDIQYAQSRLRETFWCLCPNANLYIENRLPDIEMLVEEGARICIGTDSLASNHQLSILSELLQIKRHYPALDWEQLLTWGTYKGALALQLTDQIGTIERGKRPGIIQITGLESDVNPVVKRII